MHLSKLENGKKLLGYYSNLLQDNCLSNIRSRVHNFPAWHTKAAPNGKCCEAYILPSMVRLMYQFQACWNEGRLCWKIAKLFYFCHLKKLVRPETFGTYYVRTFHMWTSQNRTESAQLDPFVHTTHCCKFSAPRHVNMHGTAKFPTTFKSSLSTHLVDNGKTRRKMAESDLFTEADKGKHCITDTRVNFS